MKKIKGLFKSNFGKKVMIIAGGTFFAQSLATLLSPIITRLFSPVDYGLLTLYSTVLGLFSLSAFSYEMAIPIAEDDDKAINVLSLCFFVLISFSLVLFFVFLFFGNHIMYLLNAEEIKNYRLLIPLGVFLVGAYSILKKWNLRKKNYKVISRTTITQSIFGNTFKIITGLLGFGALGLIIGRIIAQSAGITRLSKPLLYNQRYLFKKVQFKKVFWSAKRYKDFPIYKLSNYLLVVLTGSLPIIFISIYFGGEVLGFYGLAKSIVKLPMKLMGKSIGNVFFAEASALGRKKPKSLKKLSDKLIGKLFLFGLIPFFALVLFGPLLFGFVFGGEWIEAGVYARLIAIMLFSRLIVTPISSIFSVYEKQKLSFILVIAKTVLVVAVFGISALFSFSSYLTIFIYAITNSFMYFLTYLVAQKIIKSEIVKKEREKKKQGNISRK